MINLKQPINKEEEKILLLLASVEGVGEKTLRAVLAYRAKTAQSLVNIYHYSSWPVELFFSQKTWQAVKQLKFLDKTPDQYYEQLHNLAITPIFVWDKIYPALLRETAFAPTILYCKGQLNLLQAEIFIAVVGTRKITNYGRRATESLVEELVKLGATIVSGFMYGVDTVAHKVALKHHGSTIAVLGFGLDQMYPASQAYLFDRMLRQSALFISHFPIGVKARPGNFLQRNQLVAGLSQAVVVTEAGFPSGSFSTAQAALNEGRTVCAVPGPFDSEFSQGTKWLINEGATLVVSGSEVLSEIGLSFKFIKNEQHKKQKMNKKIEQLPATAKIVFESVSSGHSQMDELLFKTKLEMSQLTVVLTELELEGLILKKGDCWQTVVY